MLAALDVHYSEDSAHAACVAFEDWTDHEPAFTNSITLNQVVAYQPGEFYRRELQPLLAVLATIEVPLEGIIIDAYCQLDAAGAPGLGAHLSAALNAPVPIIGVAKNRFRQTTHAVELLRGASERPLFVTGVGMPPEKAAALIQTMAGDHRHPNLLKLADQLARGSAA